MSIISSLPWLMRNSVWYRIQRMFPETVLRRSFWFPITPKLYTRICDMYPSIVVFDGTCFETPRTACCLRMRVALIVLSPARALHLFCLVIFLKLPNNMAVAMFRRETKSRMATKQAKPHVVIQNNDFYFLFLVFGLAFNLVLCQPSASISSMFIRWQPDTLLYNSCVSQKRVCTDECWGNIMPWKYYKQ